MVKIKRLSEKGTANMKCDRRLYLNRDKSRVVEEGDVTSGFLFATAGGHIEATDAAKYNLEWRDGKLILPGRARAAATAEPKARKKPEDKAAKKSEDKGGTARPPDAKA